jgi:hypothetical protein
MTALLVASLFKARSGGPSFFPGGRETQLSSVIFVRFAPAAIVPQAGCGLNGRTGFMALITLGSPFAGHPKATNAWRVYEIASGRRAEEDHRFGGSLSEAPPVPTTAIFSRTDGICAWQGCKETASAIAESIEVESSHCGMGHHTAAVYAVADRLAQAEGQWKPFDRSGWRSLIYPDPNR